MWWCWDHDGQNFWLLYDKLQEPNDDDVDVFVVWYRFNRQLEFIVRDMLLI